MCVGMRVWDTGGGRRRNGEAFVDGGRRVGTEGVGEEGGGCDGTARNGRTEGGEGDGRIVKARVVESDGEVGDYGRRRNRSVRLE